MRRQKLERDARHAVGIGCERMTDDRRRATGKRF
jgi:hypothetical protein